MVALAAAVALLVPACGGEAGDLLALEVSGGFEEEELRLIVTQDGRGSCRGGPLQPIPSERLIEAREVERQLEGLAEDGTAFDAPDAGGGRDQAEGEGSRAGEPRSYVARTRAGTVRWVEGASDLPDVLPRAALLAEQLEDDLCSS